MGRSQETFGKKEVRTRKEKKRKEKEQKRAKKKSEGKKNSFDDMIAYVNEFGVITSTPPDPDKKTVVDAESIELTVNKNSPESVPDYVRKGIVIFFNDSKGYGFIREMESNQRIFVHANSLLEPITENNIVTFELTKGPKGPSALKVKLFKE
ncbi:MAG TPA: cold shock domain-containing protein [Bacteroidales bacterium]|jgi:cold shock CspA family protein|nr:cold shock domain-containing protein [Bacteroidales bacterium]HOX73517.1 cold shock domain-containing protein [Bacteroidales bacterium]HPM88734.1 cold shock domain-containing protein [Bacteroidales bacterium]HQM69226.1 cold shock domain-containing protein [Bacteroidales bacterium]